MHCRLSRNVRDVHKSFFEPLAVENLAAWLVSSELGFCDGIRSPLDHIAYFRGPVLLVVPLMESGFGAPPGKEHAPGASKSALAWIKGRSGATRAFPWMAARVELPGPTPAGLIVRDTSVWISCLPGRSPKDPPAFLPGVGGPAASKRVHTPMIPPWPGRGSRWMLGSWL